MNMATSFPGNSTVPAEGSDRHDTHPFPPTGFVPMSDPSMADKMT